jgi:hypothetical protein
LDPKGREKSAEGMKGRRKRVRRRDGSRGRLKNKSGRRGSYSSEGHGVSRERKPERDWTEHAAWKKRRNQSLRSKRRQKKGRRRKVG